MRKDVNKIYIFPMNPFTYREKNKRVYARPSEAIVIALFDGLRSVDDVIEIIRSIVCVERVTAERIVNNCLWRFKDLLVDVDDSNRARIVKYDPCDFVIPAEEVNIRCENPAIPEVVMYIPTLTCDFKCRYCYAPPMSNLNLLDCNDIRNIIEQLAYWKIPTLFLSGGDPFNSSNIWKIIELCARNSIKPILPTKTALNSKHIESLKKNRINEIQISIDTSSAAVMEFLTGSCTTHVSRLFETIHKLVEQGFSVNTNTVLTAFNIYCVPQLIEILIELGVKHMTFSQYARSLFHHNDQLFCSHRQYEWFALQIEKFKKQYSSVSMSFTNMRDPTSMTARQRRHFFDNRPSCTAGRLGMVILPDGKVTICETLYYQKDLLIGDLKCHSLSEIWASDQRQSILNNAIDLLSADACRTCSASNSCYLEKGKCYVRALQAFGDVKMPDPYCPHCPQGVRII